MLRNNSYKNKNTLRVQQQNKDDISTQLNLHNQKVLAPQNSQLKKAKKGLNGQEDISNKRMLKQLEKGQKFQTNQTVQSKLGFIKQKKEVKFQEETEQICVNEPENLRNNLSELKKNSKKRQSKTLIETYFTSPLPTLFKRVWSSLSNSTATHSRSSTGRTVKQRESSAKQLSSAQSSKTNESNESFKSISSFFCWSKTAQDMEKEESPLRKPIGEKKKKQEQYKCESFGLEDQKTGKQLNFNLYEDKDLPFLNDTNPNNKIITDNIIDGDIDDDCQTDEEQLGDSKEMLISELKKAVTQFNQAKKDGTEHNFVKNTYSKRFERTPFTN